MQDSGSLAIRQVAYFVPDIEAAARAHSETFRSGPFFMLRHIPWRQASIAARRTASIIHQPMGNGAM